jgi:hypothetical protein
MIYDCPDASAPIDQGDLIDHFPVVQVRDVRSEAPDQPTLDSATRRVVVMGRPPARPSTTTLPRTPGEALRRNLRPHRSAATI